MTVDRRGVLKLGAALGVGLAAAGALNSCGDGGGGGGAPAAGVTAATGDLSGKTITVLIYDFWEKATRERLDTWKRATGCDFNLKVVPFGDLDRTARLSARQGTPPDVVMVSADNLPGYASLGLVRPIAGVSESDLTPYFQNAVAASLIGDKFYGPPTNESSQVLAYNADVLDRNGIPAPTSLDAAWTWDEAREYFIEITTKERERRGTDKYWAAQIAAFGGMNLYSPGWIVRSAGNEGDPAWSMVSPDGLKASGYLDADPAVEALAFLQRLHLDDEVCPVSQTTDFFQSDQVAFRTVLPSTLAAVQAAAPDLSIGTMPPPYIQSPIVHCQGDHFTVGASGKEPAAAASFIVSLMSDDSAVAMATAGSSIPGRTTALSAFPDYAKQPLQMFADVATTWGAPAPITPGSAELSTAYATLLSKVIYEGADAQSEAGQTATTLDRLLQRYES